MLRQIKKSVFAAAVMFVATGSARAAVNWDAFVIRLANTQPAATPVSITEDLEGNGVTTLIDEGGEKTGYGTDFFDGQALSSIPGVSYTRLDAGNKYPYVNIWITDGTNSAVIAPAVIGGNAIISSDVNGLALQGLGMSIYESNFTGPGALDWIQPGAQRIGQMLADSNGNALTIADIGNLLVNDPGVYPNPPVGSGAPKNGTGFNLIFGDTQSNFDQAVAYQIDNVAVPEPATVGLIAIGGAALLLRRRRRV